MIKKLEITNVGRFKSAKTNGDEEYFKKNVYIYGKNTFGKSTLTAILRSLKENKPDFIVGRKTVGSETQCVKIIPEITQPTGEYRFTTDENKWSAEYKDIIIFDNHFVRESIYTQNQQIGQDQQRNIEAFMLGAKGVEYNVKISDLVEKIRVNTQTQTSINTEYSGNRHLLGGFAFADFLEMPEVADIDKRTQKEQDDLDKVKNSELISSKLTSIKLLLEKYKNFDTSKISAKLSVNSELISKHFDNHVNQKETKQAYSAFLQTGARMRTRTENECCPFCTQEIKTESVKEFLATIDQIYNQNYRDLQQGIKEAEALFSKDDFSVELEKLKTDLKQAGYLLSEDFSELEAIIESCEKSILSKKEDLSVEFDSLAFVNISTKIGNHVVSIDAELIKFQNPIEQKIKLENSLKGLKANKERYGSWKEKCENYLKAKKDNKELGEQKTALWEEYLVYANGLSETMLADINAILCACNCNFAVQTFNFKGNQRQDLLVLNMGGSQILNDGEDREMTIKNSLSDSDKWVLALAFFLAAIKNDTTIKVVVMDDPVSSFDADRKRIILKEIKRVLAGTDKQLILLTHEKGFYHLLHFENKADTSAVFLRISFDVQTGSDLIVCDPDNDPEFMSDYNCWITDMRSALICQDLAIVKNAHSNIRPVIEHILKAKYPLEIGKEETTIDKMLDKLEMVGGSYEAISPRSDISTLLPNLTHHDNSGNGQYPAQQLGIEDYRKEIRDAFVVIKKL